MTRPLGRYTLVSCSRALETLSLEGTWTPLDTLTKALVPSSTSRKSWWRTAESVRCITSAYQGTGKNGIGENFPDFRSHKL